MRAKIKERKLKKKVKFYKSEVLNWEGHNTKV